MIIDLAGFMDCLIISSIAGRAIGRDHMNRMNDTNDTNLEHSALTSTFYLGRGAKRM